MVAVTLAVFATVLPQAGRAQEPAPTIPLTRGLAIVQTLHDPQADRESVVTVEEASPAGVRYVWRFVEVHANGDTIRFEHPEFVSAADLAGAPRVHLYEETGGPAQHPGYTIWSLSTAVYRKLRTEGSDTLQFMCLDDPWGIRGSLAEFRARFGGARDVPVRWRGTVVRTSAAPEPFPLLVNGRRVAVPALRLRGQFTASRQRHWEPEIWVLADSVHPLFLKLDPSAPNTVFQTVRVDLPDEGNESLVSTAALEDLPGGTGGRLDANEGEGKPAQGAGKLMGPPGRPMGKAGPPGGAAGGMAKSGSRAAAIEGALASACRVELPGVYFAFNSAVLDPASDRTTAALARMLIRHPNWKLTIEGHTDSIGSASANQTLSVRRAEAVRSRLITANQVDAGRLGAAGYGASRPREPNATIEGRARNRRVELVRDCRQPQR